MVVFRKPLYGGGGGAGAGARPAKQQRKEVKDEADEVAEVALLQLVLVLPDINGIIALLHFWETSGKTFEKGDNRCSFSPGGCSEGARKGGADTFHHQVGGLSLLEII